MFLTAAWDHKKGHRNQQTANLALVVLDIRLGIDGL